MKEEKKEMNGKLVGVIIVIAAILLMVLAITTNFFADMSGFDAPQNEESGEVLQPDEKDQTVGYSTGFIPAGKAGIASGEIKVSGEVIRTPRQGAKPSGD